MELLTDYTVRIVALGSGILGAVAGTLGSFAFLRRQSLLGDAVSHAALPGIAIAFLLTGSRAPLVIMLGAAFAGFGLILLTYIQRMPNAAQAGLDSYLFGQAAALLRRDVVAMALLGGVAVVLVFVLWKEFKILSFDSAFGTSLGLPMVRMDVLLTSLLVVAIVIGLQTVGVVLMSAMIVAPAAAARQWTQRLGAMVLVSAAIGVAAGVLGSVTSALVPRLPTGPTIVLLAWALWVGWSVPSRAK